MLTKNLVNDIINLASFQDDFLKGQNSPKVKFPLKEIIDSSDIESI